MNITEIMRLDMEISKKLNTILYNLLEGTDAYRYIKDYYLYIDDKEDIILKGPKFINGKIDTIITNVRLSLIDNQFKIIEVISEKMFMNWRDDIRGGQKNWRYILESDLNNYLDEYKPLFKNYKNKKEILGMKNLIQSITLSTETHDSHEVGIKLGSHDMYEYEGDIILYILDQLDEGKSFTHNDTIKFGERDFILKGCIDEDGKVLVVDLIPYED